MLLQACFETARSPPPGPPAAATRLSSPEALRPFLAALAGIDRRQARHPLRILQIGDSHSANDSFSGRLRERFQGRFGAAGRGWLPAGVPYKYYRPHLVNVSETGWRHFKPSDHAGVALGLDAVVAESQPPDSSMAIESSEPAGFDRFAVEYLTRPNGSAFTVQIDGAAPVRVATAAAETAIKRFDLPLDHPARRVELRAAAQPAVDLLGWTVERRHTPGIVYENHGTIGATIDLLGQMTPQAVAFELSERQPALIIVAFGTNEGFDDGLDLDRYAARFQADVAALQRRAPGAAILVLGPPDGNRHAKDCAPVASCRPNGDAGADDCRWHEPPKLAGVRSVQRRLARQHGWAHWDWFAAMGGACSIDRMAVADPPLAMPDHVHLRTPGYETVADTFFADLMAEYDRWQAQARGS
ncbi:MAG TPA: GDSL-type esterase/lipase family protein [Stellaceae bacterium]|nr:GDSL-type esterase/lipase family protein [Stellaceae bacterium]